VGGGDCKNVVSYVTGKVWIKQMMISAFLLPVLICGTAFFINFIAIYYHASRAIPFGTMVSISPSSTGSLKYTVSFGAFELIHVNTQDHVQQ